MRFFHCRRPNRCFFRSPRLVERALCGFDACSESFRHKKAPDDAGAFELLDSKA
jgi:hypothetical protein